MSQTLDTLILLFAKPPVAGKVKTRLMPAVGAEGACRMHRRLLQHTVQQVNRADIPAVLWAADNPQHPAFNGIDLTGWQRELQSEGDLGARMLTAATAGLKQAQKILLIGSDCLLLDKSVFEQVAVALDDKPVVFVPAEDGGYVLLGLTKVVPSLFKQIDWGTPHVLAQSRQYLQQEGVEWAELPELWDIDRPEDLVRLQQVLPELCSGLSP